MNSFSNNVQIYVIIIFLCIFSWRILSLYLKRGIRPISSTSQNDTLRGRLTVSLIIAISTWVSVTLLYALNANIQSVSSFLVIELFNSLGGRIGGVLFMMTGLIVYAIALINLGDAWRIGNNQETPSKLVTHGIYKVSRNPIYLSLALLLIGTLLINGTLIFLILTILVILNLHYLILREEKLLSKIYGKAFSRYCGSTPRYIFF
jgi:protein-S-isoprenylcysteine O-methyltransferase Ste14